MEPLTFLPLTTVFFGSWVRHECRNYLAHGNSPHTFRDQSIRYSVGVCEIIVMHNKVTKSGMGPHLAIEMVCYGNVFHAIPSPELI